MKKSPKQAAQTFLKTWALSGISIFAVVLWVLSLVDYSICHRPLWFILTFEPAIADLFCACLITHENAKRFKRDQEMADELWAEIDAMTPEQVVTINTLIDGEPPTTPPPELNPIEDYHAGS